MKISKSPRFVIGDQEVGEMTVKEYAERCKERERLNSKENKK